MAQQRELEITATYEDQISGTKAKRPGLDQLLADARRGKFEVVLVWACDRLARSVSHFLQVLDELNHLQIEFLSFREQLDTGGPLGRAMVVIISVIAELERNLVVERVKAGLRRVKLEGRRLGRPRLEIDSEALVRDWENGASLGELAKTYHVSRATVCKRLKQNGRGGHKTLIPPPPEVVENKRGESSILTVQKTVV